MKKWTRKSSDYNRTRNVSLLSTVALIVTLSLGLLACGGSSVGSNDTNSSSSGGGTPSPASTSPNSAVLVWNAISATNLAGYRVYYGTAPGNYLQSFGQGLSVGNITSYTLMGLSNGIRYYFAVTAVDTSGNESVYSNEAFKDIP